MNKKPKVILYVLPYQSHSFFHSPWFKSIVEQNFQLEVYDKNNNYNKDDVFVTGCNIYIKPEHRDFLKDKKLIIDTTWESFVGKWGNIYEYRSKDHFFLYGNVNEDAVENVTFVPNFFWYQESLLWKYKKYYPYTPKRDYSKKFLLPIGHLRQWREQVLNSLEPYLNDSLWSCLQKGIHLPGKIFKEGKRTDFRYSNPMWYDQTYFSIVLETAKSWENMSLFLTEKTMKPLGFKHPFMLMGGTGALKYLKSQGFVTYSNLFDESYDDISNFDLKLKILLDNIKNFKEIPFDNETIRRTEHNYNLFYDESIVNAGLKKDLIEPILNFIERR